MELAGSDQLIIFVKAPRPGGVKTRLAQALGAETACAIYRRLVDRLVRNVAGVPCVALWFSPDDARQEVSVWAQPGWSLHPQGEGDLGHRLAHAFKCGFAGGAQRLVIIGSDCPDVMPADVAEAFEALLAHDVVLGPAQDGGYWLIGLKQMQPELFLEIAWSTAKVLAQTLDKARSQGLTVRLLRTLADVDTERDWRALGDLPSIQPLMQP